MPTTNVPTDPPPVISATTRLTGINDARVAQLEHDHIAVTFVAPGGTLSIIGPIADVRFRIRDIDRQIDIIRRSGPSH